MSDPTNPHIKTRSTAQWGLYQRENFLKANQGQAPLFNTRTHSKDTIPLYST
jgi:hypothetical protein